MTSRKATVNIAVDDDIRERVDDFYFGQRFPSRSAAVMELLRLGFEYLNQHPDYKRGDIFEK